LWLRWCARAWWTTVGAGGGVLTFGVLGVCVVGVCVTGVRVTGVLTTGVLTTGVFGFGVVFGGLLASGDGSGAGDVVLPGLSGLGELVESGEEPGLPANAAVGAITMATAMSQEIRASRVTVGKPGLEGAFNS
jgi:hypothetical protein